MKMKQEHYQVLKAGIEAIDRQAIAAHKIDLLNDSMVKDLDKRLRWDCLHATKIKIGDGNGMSGLPLYGYLNDDHIDTALKAIFKELGL